MSKLFKIPNEIKLKLGMRIDQNKNGQIAPDLVEQAQMEVRKACANSYDAISTNLVNLIEVWNKMKSLPESLERELCTKQIFTLAHEIKDIGGLCGYALIAHFGESLRDYIAQTALNLKNQQIIIQAHIDAMNTAHKQKMRENGGPAAEELKRIVKIAIEKYH